MCSAGGVWKYHAAASGSFLPYVGWAVKRGRGAQLAAHHQPVADRLLQGSGKDHRPPVLVLLLGAVAAGHHLVEGLADGVLVDDGVDFLEIDVHLLDKTLGP